MSEVEILQCYVCGNHNVSHFRRLKSGYICDHCNTYHYYLMNDERERCLIGYSYISGYRFSEAEDKFREVLRDYPDSIVARWGINGKAVTSIDSSAFWFCSNLQSITIPDSVTSIGNGVFSGCTNLQNITIPDGVTSIDKNAFYLCNSLKTITFKGTCAEWKSIQIGSLGKDLTIQCTDGTISYKNP